MSPVTASAGTSTVFAGARSRAQYLAWLSLALSGWVMTTLLVTVGLFGVAFFLLGNASLLGMMRQLELFASHYGSAAADVRASFDLWLLKGSSILFLGVGFFRRSSLLAILGPQEVRHG